MNIKNFLILVLSWFCISGIIAFTVTVTVTLGSKTEKEYTYVINNIAEIQAAGYQLEQSFDAVLTAVSELDFVSDEFYAVYGNLRPNSKFNSIASAVTPAELNFPVSDARAHASDALKGLIAMTVFISVAGIAVSVFVARKYTKFTNGENNHEEV